MKVLETLLSKAKEDKLAHFYIVESAEPEEIASESLIKFTHEFIREYYQKIEGQKSSMVHLMDHPDVYVLGNTDQEDKETKAFTVEESEAFARFFEFKPVQSKRKFAIITEAQRINVTVANKWLKLFEEPQGQVTIFVLNPRRQKLLETIHSRALHLRLPFKQNMPDQSEWNEFIQTTKTLTLSQFLETYSKGDRDLEFWTMQWARFESEAHDNPQAKTALQSWMKKLQEMEVFHQPSATKWTLFHSALSENVLNRKNH